MAEVAANTAMETSTNGAAEAAATATKANGTSGKKKHAVELSLESKLLARPSANELVGKNVLRAGDVASAISAMQAEFQRTKLEDSLNRKLANRPSRERLVELNLMKADSMSPEMQRKQHEVQKSFMEMKLNRKLANRPTRETLAEKNLLKDGDPELLKTKNTIQRKMIESKLNSQLSSKYSTRWSAGKGGEAAPLLTKWDRKREQSPNSPEVEQAAHASSFVPMPSSKDASPASKLQHNISSFSLLQKSSFIQQLQDEGRFVCINCCSEDFQGPELSSPRYSWDDFYNEEEWKLLGLEKPRHSEDAKKKNLCNMCFGLCACGFSIGSVGACTNCGSLKPISGKEQWRAPEHRRPRTYEEVEGRRAAQLQKFHQNEHKTAKEIINNGQTTRKIQFKTDIKVRYFQRFRFRNSFNDDCYLLSLPPRSKPVPEDHVPELFVEDATESVPVAKEQEGMLFFEPDGDGNVFVVAPFEVSDDGVNPWKADEDVEEAGKGLADNAQDGDDLEDDDEDEHDNDNDDEDGSADSDISEEENEHSDADDGDNNGPMSTMKKATQLNSTRVFLYDPNKDLFYYADKSQGEIFCWNPVMGYIHRV